MILDFWGKFLSKMAYSEEFVFVRAGDVSTPPLDASMVMQSKALVIRSNLLPSRIE